MSNKYKIIRSINYPEGLTGMLLSGVKVKILGEREILLENGVTQHIYIFVEYDKFNNVVGREKSIYKSGITLLN